MLLSQLLAAKGHEVHSVAPGDSVFVAIRQMADRHIGALLVLEGGRLAGIVSERDYARKVVLSGRSSSNTPVRDIMSTPVITVAHDQTVEDAMRLMTLRRIRHLPVLQDGVLVGVLSIGDLVKEMISEQEFIIRQLENYIHG